MFLPGSMVKIIYLLRTLSQSGFTGVGEATKRIKDLKGKVVAFVAKLKHSRATLEKADKTLVDLNKMIQNLKICTMSSGVSLNGWLKHAISLRRLIQKKRLVQ